MRKSFQSKILLVPFILILLYYTLYFRTTAGNNKTSNLKNIKDLTSNKGLGAFFPACQSLGIRLASIDADLLKSITGSTITEVNWYNGNSLHIFAVLDVKDENLQKLIALMKGEGFNTWTKSQDDPRKISVLTENTTKITTHIVFWEPAVQPTQIVQLVLFHNRSDYFWHGSVKEEREQPPLQNSIVSRLFGQSAGGFDRFQTKKVSILTFGSVVEVPVNIPRFLTAKEHSQFIECNYPRIRKFYTTHKHDTSPQTELFRTGVMAAVKRAKEVLDSLDVPFWLESGTLLGWTRHCGVFLTEDADIALASESFRPDIHSKMLNKETRPISIFGLVNDSYIMSFRIKTVKLDVYLYYKDNVANQIWKGIVIAPTGQKFKLTLPTFKLCRADLKGVLVRIPCTYETVVSTIYGKDWETPFQGKWEFASSPRNIKENGYWSKEQRKQVIQLF